ncbi:MAG: hypothetical protein NC393_09325 [Clostridium sp.]|nr:hypothetical protein [Clostridium sp.]MCM1172312.1 hypothetical protein [Clostridium sp.]MCM1208977.1 hypothetical protein [Ruminococcus sp.]
MEDENKYNYTYSAKEQAEVKQIRDKYCPKQDDKLEQLRRLDAGVTRKGMIAALTMGIIGCLILGTGMSCIMVWGEKLFVLGIIVGIVGIAGVAAAYPLYSHITKKEKERIAPEIIRISDELLK